MERKSRKIIQFLSFMSIFFIGLVLLLDVLLGSNLAFMTTLKNIAYALSFIVVIINGFYYVRTKRSNIFLLLYIIGVLMLLTCFVIPFVV